MIANKNQMLSRLKLPSSLTSQLPHATSIAFFRVTRDISVRSSGGLIKKLKCSEEIKIWARRTNYSIYYDLNSAGNFYDQFFVVDKPELLRIARHLKEIK